MHLILFDIDGTLIDSGEAGTRSLKRTFEELFALPDAFHGINMAGKTDTEIIKEGLLKNRIYTNEHLGHIINTYLQYLQEEIHNDRKHIKPGIYELLDKCTLLDKVSLGLLTGNLERGARIKLEPFGLNKYFPSGAFGSDDEDRNKLLPIARERFEILCQSSIDFRNCIVVGDTPRDVYCTKPYGAMCIGVATGPYPVDALRQAGADHVFEDLSDYSKLRQVLFDIPFD